MRGVHTLSQLATDAYEISRAKIQNHLNAKHLHEVLLLLEQPLVLTWFQTVYCYIKTWI
jgi:selenocysteine lyase/cysteine desulfurase